MVRGKQLFIKKQCRFKNKKCILFLSLFFIILLSVSISYAYWTKTYEQSDYNKVVTSCFSLELVNEENAINLQKAYPILDEDGKKLTPYSFTVKNTCNLFASYTISLEVLKDSTMDSKYIRLMLNNNEIQNLASLETTDTILDGSVESRILGTGVLGQDDSEDYTLRIWMDEDITIDDVESMNHFYLR